MSLHIIGPLGIRDFVLPEVCMESVGHEHNEDHVTIVVKGAILVKYSYMDKGVLVSGESARFNQGQEVLIRKGVKHTIKALEPNTMYKCVFSHRDYDGVITQTYTGNQLAYQ